MCLRAAVGVGSVRIVRRGIQLGLAFTAGAMLLAFTIQTSGIEAWFGESHCHSCDGDEGATCPPFCGDCDDCASCVRPLATSVAVPQAALVLALPSLMSVPEIDVVVEPEQTDVNEILTVPRA